MTDKKPVVRDFCVSETKRENSAERRRKQTNKKKKNRRRVYRSSSLIAIKFISSVFWLHSLAPVDGSVTAEPTEVMLAS